ncbi:MAG TPA: secretion protein F [Ruminiclostridium sp.]|nr:secretion protein F [Ruminiclostridium sp.]
MIILLILFAALFAVGLFLIFADVLKLSTMKAAKAMLNTGKKSKRVSQIFEAYLMSWAVRLSKIIHMDEYRKGRMSNVLKAADINMAPEVYTAYAIVKAGAALTGVIPCLLIFPLLSPVFVILAVLIYFKESKRADEKLRAKREQIDSELPRFAATIEQSLKSSRDVLAMLENYKKNAGAAFRRELDIVTADMRSSGYEAALTRFEARMNSSRLSDVVRGLIGVLRGDDGAVYFRMLGHDFKALELQRLKGEAQKIPPKIRIFSFIMLMCFMFTYLVIIAYEILKSLGGMF